jgi:hypothetical protein
MHIEGDAQSAEWIARGSGPRVFRPETRADADVGKVA